MVKYNLPKVTIKHLKKGKINVNAKDVKKYLAIDGFSFIKDEAKTLKKK